MIRKQVIRWQFAHGVNGLLVFFVSCRITQTLVVKHLAERMKEAQRLFSPSDRVESDVSVDEDL
jgi:hypothetical protein